MRMVAVLCLVLARLSECSTGQICPVEVPAAQTHPKLVGVSD